MRFSIITSIYRKYSSILNVEDKVNYRSVKKVISSFLEHIMKKVYIFFSIIKNKYALKEKTKTSEKKQKDREWVDKVIVVEIRARNKW